MQLRQLPSVDELLRRPGVEALIRRAGRTLVVEAARRVLEETRAAIQAAPSNAPALLEPDQIEERIAIRVAGAVEPSLRGVINATGVILHTNLGRAPLPDVVLERLRTATQYSNLEYDVAAGVRGRRDVHTARLLAGLLGAEAAIVVNNNAAAVLLVLNTLAKGGEVIVSRGELIEIGDGFRIPDIMAESGALLREVGTTNRTRLADYQRAINERTRLLLRVHPSNFRIVGFTERPSLEELTALGREHDLPVYEDLGSGCLVDLSLYGLQEPVARASLAAGVSLVSFSGDKLLGGPQAGIIAGRHELVERVRRNPLFRALRVDKLTIAALEATLAAYLCEAFDEIPVLRMLQIPHGEIELRAQALAERLNSRLAASEARVEVRSGYSVVGGGSTPGEQLPTRLVAITSPRYSAAQLEERLRTLPGLTPVVARVEDDRLVLDLRTVFPEQEDALAGTLLAALR